MKKLLIAAGFVLAATSASLAQGYGYYGPSYGYSPYNNGVAVYDEAPGSYAAPYAYDYAGYGPYYQRGGPGPRVGNGTGMGIGAVR